MPTYNTPFMQKPDAGFRLGDIRAIYDAIVSNNARTAAYGITAAGTTQATATQLTSVLNQVDTVSASTGVNLPWTQGTRTTAFQSCYVINNGANTLTVYAAQGKSDTINGTAGATGVSIPAGANILFISAKPGVWEAFGGLATQTFGNITTTGISNSGNETFTAANSGVVLKQGANGRVGTFVANGTTTVTISNTSIAISDAIIISLNTVGGTVGALPKITTITAATGFTVVCTASDTSTYNYACIGNAA